MNLSIKYSGLPLHISIDGITVKWSKIFEVIKYINLKSHDIIIDGFRYLPYYGILYINERDNWIYDYLPIDGVEDKIILDIGAGCGETAKFYLDNGAKKVICIEPDYNAYKYLLHNSYFDDRIIPIHKYFNIDMLNIKHDFMKMDIEGAEILFLLYANNYNKSCVIEAHSNYIINKLINAEFVRYTYDMPNQAIMQRNLR